LPSTYPAPLRDRALIALLVYTFARVSAAIGINVADYYYVQGRRSWARLHEKDGKRHEMPAHHLLETYMDAYLADTGLAADKAGPLPHRCRPYQPAYRPDDPHRRAAHDLASGRGGRHGIDGVGAAATADVAKV